MWSLMNECAACVRMHAANKVLLLLRSQRVTIHCCVFLSSQSGGVVDVHFYRRRSSNFKLINVALLLLASNWNKLLRRRRWSRTMCIIYCFCQFHNNFFFFFHKIICADNNVQMWYLCELRAYLFIYLYGAQLWTEGIHDVMYVCVSKIYGFILQK